MRYGLINNFRTTLATAALTDGQTSMDVSSGGVNFADASTDYRYKLTLVQTDSEGVETHREIVDVVGASGNTLTIEGGKEGTTRLTGGWPIGTTMSARITADIVSQLEPLVQVIGTVDFTNAASSASWVAPPGKRFFVDSVDVVAEGSGTTGGSWGAEAGTPTLTGYGRTVDRSPDGTLIAIAHETSPSLTILDASDYSVVAGTPTFATRAYAAHFSPDGTRLAVVHSGSPYLTVLDTSDWSTIAGTPTIAGLAYTVRYNHDGSMLAVGHNGGNFLSVYNTADWTSVTVPAPSGVVNGVDWNNDSTQLAVGTGTTPFLDVYETSGWTILSGTPNIGRYTYTVSYNSDGTILAVGHEADNTLQVFNVSGWSTITLPTMPSAGSTTSANYVAFLDWHPVSGDLAVAHGTGPDYVAILDSSTWELKENPSVAGRAGGIVHTSDGGTLYVAHRTSPYFTATTFTSTASPKINIGTDAGNPATLLSAVPLELFVNGERITKSVAAKVGVTSLRVEPDTVSAEGALATVVVHGYTLETA